VTTWHTHPVTPKNGIKSGLFRAKIKLAKCLEANITILSAFIAWEMVQLANR
jgi:hypothetical protein